jgi:hypothetical protein
MQAGWGVGSIDDMSSILLRVSPETGRRTRQQTAILTAS